MTTDKERFYDTIAGDFDRLMNLYDLQRRLDVALGELLCGESLAGKLLLDAGCGTGHFSRRARELGAQVVSLDISPRLVALARGRARLLPSRVQGGGTAQPELRPPCCSEGDALGVVGDATAIGFRDGVFDVVLSSEMVEHTHAPRQAVAELVRVLKPGGRLILTCPNAIWHWSVRVAGWLRLRPYEGYENWPGWFEMRRWLREEGVRVQRMRGIHLFPFVVPFLNPLLRVLDGLGGVLGPLYVNMAVSGVKTAPAL